MSGMPTTVRDGLDGTGGSARRLGLRVVAVTLALLLLATGGLSLFLLGQFERDLLPEMDRKAAAVGGNLVRDIQRAVDFGLPFDRLRGMDPVLDAVLQETPELRYLAVTDAAGRVLYSRGIGLYSRGAELNAALRRHFQAVAAGPAQGALPAGRSVAVGSALDTTLPIEAAPGAEAGTVGFLHVGVDARFAQRQLTDSLADVGVVLLVSLLVTFELVLFTIASGVSRPIEALKRLAAAVRAGDLSLRIDRPGHDEIGAFIAAANTTLQRLNERQAAIASRLASLPAGLAGRAAVAERLRRLESRYRFVGTGQETRLAESQAGAMRTALFLFIFADSLSLSFFPVFVGGLYQPIPYLSKAMAISLPISLFWLLVAVAQPLAGIWSERQGRRQVFCIGALVAAAGLMATAHAGDIYQVLLWRSLTALGYGAVFIVAQSYLLDAAPDRRTQGAAVFTSTFFSATICGTAIGGILADQLGYAWTFQIAAALSVGAAAFVLLLVSGEPERQRQAQLRWRDLVTVLGNRRFLMLSMFAAVPARLLNAAFLLYLAPLYLHFLDLSKPAAARVLMLYALIMTLGSPLWARLVDRLRRPLPFVVVGGLLSGAAMLVVFLRADLIGVVLAISLMGLAQSFSITSQVTLATKVTPAEVERLGQGAVIGVFRLLERAGSIAGPFLAATLAGVYGYAGGMAGTGLLVFACAVVLGLFFLAAGKAARTRVTGVGE